MKKFMLIIAVALLLFGGCAILMSGSNTTTTTPSPGDTTAERSETESPTAPVPAPKKESGKLSDNGWVLESYKFRDDGLGAFGGTARITNTNNKSMTAVFTITLFQTGDQVASLMGSAQEVETGKTVTVDLISQDEYKKGKYTVDFQVDTSY